MSYKDKPLAEQPPVVTPQAVWGAQQSGLRLYYALLAFFAYADHRVLSDEELLAHAKWLCYVIDQREAGPVWS